MIPPEQPTIAWRRDCPYLLALVAIGVVVNLIFSRMGFMPLDHSIIFDAGWRILNGQVPWRDFVTPAGVVPAAMQALFFAAFGTTWFAFCLHSSLVNGLFAAILYVLLVILRLPRPLAFFYGLCATFFFYPPIGVPYMDQHSFFFTLAAITCAVAGNHAESERAQKILWASVPVLALLAFFSKQVPFVFGAVSLPVILLLPGRSAIRRRLWSCLAGAAASLAVVLLLGFALGVNRADFIEYVFVRPSHVSRARFKTWSAVAEIALGNPVAPPERMGMRFARGAIHLYLAALIAFPFVLALCARARSRQPEMRGEASRLSCSLLLAPVTYLSSMLFQFVTNNQGQNALAFYPVSAALVHAALCTEIRVAGLGATLFLAHRKKLVAIAGPVAIVALSIAPLRDWMFDTIAFARNVDGTRIVNDMMFDAKIATDSASQLPAGMEFVRWTAPPGYHVEGWAALVAFLRSHKGNVLIIGDNLVTYALAGKPSIAPNLWFHPGLSLPAAEEPAFTRYQEELIWRVEHNDVRYIVIEGQHTWARLSVDQLHEFSAWLTRLWCPTRSFGENRVFERCTPSDHPGID